jgi:hypothetical protein
VTELERMVAVMAEDFHHRNVGIVAFVIGAVVLLLGLGGLVLHIS